MNQSPESSTPSILVADDQQDVIKALRLLIKSQGCHIESTTSPAGILEALKVQEFDVLLMDLNFARDTTSGQEGLDLLSRIQTLDPTLPVVVMTAWGSIELAVEAVRRGARDFIQKPWDNQRMVSILRTQVELSRSLRKEKRLEAANQVLSEQQSSKMIAHSPAMQDIRQMILKIAPSEANVLITGENGTGKGVVAQEIHRFSKRSAQPLVTVNVGGLSEGIFESELFGHVKGAFTDAKVDRVGRFEMAKGGTLFLDEIANIPLSLQAKFLRVLETGEFERVGSSRTMRADARIISATNANLYEDVKAGKYRQDLLFRLNTIEIKLPPLRQRTQDIPALAEHFLKSHCAKYCKPTSRFEPSALAALAEYAWPGNVRELSHVIERAVLLAHGDTISSRDLGLYAPNEQKMDLDQMSLEEIERYLIKRMLARCDGNVSKAADALGLSRSAFYRRLQKFGL